MTAAGFLQRLGIGKAVNCVYQVGDRAGLISAWSYGEGFVLTWEECPGGNQYNEHTYSRDERYEFRTAQEVLTFVEQSGYPAAAFQP